MAEPFDSTETSRYGTWPWMFALAVLLHVPLLYALALIEPHRPAVRVVAMSPAPGATLSLPAGVASTEVTVKLDWLPHGDEPLPYGAALFALDDHGGERWLGFARLDAKDPTLLRFGLPVEAGRYRVRLDAGGIGPLLGPSLALDGELGEGLPSGDGVAGGDFEAEFTLALRPQTELIQAQIVRAEPPKPLPSVAPRELPRIDAPTPTPTPRAPRAANPRPSPEPSPVHETSPRVVIDDELPLRRPEPKEADIRDLFEMSPGELEQLYGDAAEQTIARLADEAEREGLFGGWEEDWAKVQGALNGAGPKVKPGNQKAVSLHRRDVEEYVANIHKIIHVEWADTYLIDLDLRRRDLRDPINDPNLSTVVEIEMDETGVVSDVQLVSTSGVGEYDAEAVRVALGASPREPVPEVMLSDNGKAYLHWTFWRDQRQCGVFGVEVFVLADGQKQGVGLDLDRVRAEEERLGIHDGASSQRAMPWAEPASEPTPALPIPEPASPPEAAPEPSEPANDTPREARPQTRKRGG